MEKQDIAQTVTNYILEQFLPGESSDSLSETTPLISGGILSSIDTLKLVAFLEEHYHIEFKAHEINADYLDDIANISKVIFSKTAGKNLV